MVQCLVHHFQEYICKDSKIKTRYYLFAVYKDEGGKSYTLPVVGSVEAAIALDKTLTHDYLSIGGLKDMCQAATKLALGNESIAIVEDRVCYPELFMLSCEIPCNAQSLRYYVHLQFHS